VEDLVERVIQLISLITTNKQESQSGC